jgi:hypothetical protein
MIEINQLRFAVAQSRVAQPVITDEKHLTYSNREIHTRKICRKTRIRRFWKRKCQL